MKVRHESAGLKWVFFGWVFFPPFHSNVFFRSCWVFFPMSFLRAGPGRGEGESHTISKGMPNCCRRRKCRCCHQLYDPDHTQPLPPRPTACSPSAARPARPPASAAGAEESDKGRDYFHGSANRQRVKAWRMAHPGYARKRPKPSGALQDHCPLQTIAPPEVNPSLSERALQEMIVTQGLLLTGFIAHYTGYTSGALQENIAPTIDRLIRLGQQMQGPSTLLRVDPAIPAWGDPARGRHCNRR